MAGYTDKITRAIGYLSGADMCYTEMISCEGIIRGNPRTEPFLERWTPGSDLSFIQNPEIREFLENFEEPYLPVQLFSGNPKAVGNAAAALSSRNPSLIDINCGCPMPKICRTGAGAALLQYPEKIREMIIRVKEAADCPVSIKIRSGEDENSLSYKWAVDAALEAGVDAISVHPRTKAQGYSGTSDWNVIRHVAELAGDSVPVFGSGDLYAPEDAERMLAETGCSGVMFARGAVGNPEIFRTAKALLTGKEAFRGFSRKELAILHLGLAVRFYGESKGSKIIKKFLAAYVKNVPDGPEYRRKLVTAQDSSSMKAVLETIPEQTE